MSRSQKRGHEVFYRNKKYYYSDTGGSAKEERPCKKCGAEFDGDEPDKCLGKLPGVKYACCGHGDQEHAYIMFENGVVLRKFIVQGA